MSDILHVDLDAFYVSVERRRRGGLDRVPVVVGWPGPRGVVLSCSYEARAKGVRNGMPGARARRLCPEAVFVPPDFGPYQEASEAFRDVLHSITPSIEPISLDEAFCDVAGAHRLYGSSEDIASEIRSRVAAQLGLTCSVGGGPSKLIAKLASRACKPDGALVVHDALAFLHPLPIEELWGVGKATAQALQRLGLRTVGDIARTPQNVLVATIGEAAGSSLHALANGRDERRVVTEYESKSIGAEETFDEDLASDERIRAEILRLADRVAERLVRHDLYGRTITLKIRLQDFTTKTRSRTLASPTSDVWTIFGTAKELYDNFKRGRMRVRLVGVSMSGLTDGRGAEQLTLEPRKDRSGAEDALVRARKRFGPQAVRLGRLVSPAGEETARSRRGTGRDAR